MEIPEIKKVILDYASQITEVYWEHNCFQKKFDLTKVQKLAKPLLSSKIRQTLRKNVKDLELIDAGQKKIQSAKNLLESVLVIQFESLIKSANEEKRNVWQETLDVEGKTITYRELFDVVLYQMDYTTPEYSHVYYKSLEFLRERYAPIFFAYAKSTNAAARSIGERNYRRLLNLNSKDIEEMQLVFDSIPYTPTLIPSLPLKQMPLKTVQQTLSSLHFNTDHIQVHIGDGVPPRCYFSPLGDVRISLTKNRKEQLIHIALHEFGHAMHFSYHDSSDPFLLTSEPSLSEAYAMFFEKLTSNPLWLEEHTTLKPSEIDASIQQNRTYTLTGIKSNSSRFLVDHAIFVKRNTGVKEYQESQVSFFGKKSEHPEWRFVGGIGNPPLYGIHHTQGQLIASSLTKHIEEKFGKKWFTKTSAGDYLKEIWHTTTCYTLEETLTTLGLPTTVKGLLEQVLDE